MVYAWGNNAQGQLGDGTTTERTLPVAVVGLPNGLAIMDISCGANSLAVDSNGQLWAWGDNSVGEVGDGTHVNRASPVHIALMRSGGVAVALPPIASVACGGSFNLALSQAGVVYAWGTGGAEGGLLGSGEALAEATQPIPVDRSGVLAGKDVAKISAGVRHSLALTTDGTLVAWGRNFEGQIGVGSLPPYQTAFAPVLVSGSGSLSGKQVAQCAAGYDFSMVLDTLGGLHSWGDNSNGSLGLGDTTNRDHPTAIATAGNPLANRSITAIAAGLAHGLVLAADNVLISWGANGSGQLGQGDFSAAKPTPGRVLLPDIMAGRPIESLVASSSSNSSGVVTTPVAFVALTLPAASIGATSALLNGSANTIFTYFELGTDTTYGSISQGPTFPLSGNQELPVAGTVGGLTPGTTYHFRLVASSFTGPVVGLDHQFTTAGPDLNALAEWRVVQFGAGGVLGDPADAADPDGDGSSNLLEFAMGTDPKAFSAPPALQIDGESLVFPYQRNDAAAGLVSYQVEWWDGGIGIPWSNAGVVDNFLSDNGAIQQWQAVMPKGPNGQRMVRLRVTTLP
ncbi:MAG: hypothetical protein WCK77_21765 [Verrucomicrobiota bacterium]